MDRRRDLVPALQRTRRGQRPRGPRHPGGPSRRNRMGGQRPEGVDLARSPGALGTAARPVRPRRAQARGAVLLRRRHARPRGRGAPAAPAHRRGGVQRGVPHRRADPGRRPAGRRRRGLACCPDDADERAGVDRQRPFGAQGGEHHRLRGHGLAPAPGAPHPRTSPATAPAVGRSRGGAPRGRPAPAADRGGRAGPRGFCRQADLRSAQSGDLGIRGGVRRGGRAALRRLDDAPRWLQRLQPRSRVPLPADQRQLDRGRHLRDPAQHHRRARSRPAARAPRRYRRRVEGVAPLMTVATDLLYSDTERTLASALADLLSSRAAPADVLARTEKPETYDTDLWRTVAADIGLAGLLIPEALGGAGASYRELAAAAETFGAALAPVPYLGSAAVSTAVLLSAARSSAASPAAPAAPSPGAASVAPGAAAFAAPATSTGTAAPSRAAPVSPAAELLRRMADGGLTAALAVEFAAGPGLSEGAEGHPAASQQRTRFPAAVRVAGPGDGAARTTRLRGTIPAVADALPADVLLVPAEGVPNGVYLVEATAPGLHRTPIVSLDMTRQLCDISLDDAPARQIVVADAAAAAVDAGLTVGAAMLAAEQLGLAQRCLDMTVGYLKERRQFARQIGSFQG